jgi:hypothetical protein
VQYNIYMSLGGKGLIFILSNFLLIKNINTKYKIFVTQVDGHTTGNSLSRAECATVYFSHLF